MKTVILMFIGALSLFGGSVQAKTPLKGLGYGIKGAAAFCYSDYPGYSVFEVAGGVFADYPLPERCKIGGDILYCFGAFQKDSCHELNFRPKVGLDFRATKQKKYFWQWPAPSISYKPPFWQWFIPAISYAPHFVLKLPLESMIPSSLWLGGCLTWQLPYRLQLEVNVGKVDNDVWELRDGWYFQITFGYRWLAV